MRRRAPRGVFNEGFRRSAGDFMSLGAMAFVLHMVIWAALAPAMAMGQRTILCTPAGLEVVTIGADGKPVPADQPGAVSIDHCPLCLLAAGVGAPPSPVVMPSTADGFIPFVPLVSETPLPAGRPLPAPWPRGPPIV